MELELSEFSVRAAMEQALALVRERAALHRITVTLRDRPDPGSDHLRRAAVQAGHAEPAQQRRQVHPDGGHIAVQQCTRRDWLTVTVTDNGSGSRPEDQERIFESFHQGRRGGLSGGGHGTRAHPVPAHRHVDGWRDDPWSPR
jgi:signal transduction histidine kinase